VGVAELLVLRRRIEEGSTTIATDLPSAIEATFKGFETTGYRMRG
jgi:hypothetical protein